MKFELPEFRKGATLSHQFITEPELLVNNVSFSHIREIMVISDSFERFFMKQNV